MVPILNVQREACVRILKLPGRGRVPGEGVHATDQQNINAGTPTQTRRSGGRRQQGERKADSEDTLSGRPVGDCAIERYLGYL